MPRRTRTRKQRRLAAYAQRQREHNLVQLTGDLRRLWREYEAQYHSSASSVGAGYIDLALTFRRSDVA